MVDGISGGQCGLFCLLGRDQEIESKIGRENTVLMERVAMALVDCPVVHEHCIPLNLHNYIITITFYIINFIPN